MSRRAADTVNNVGVKEKLYPLTFKKVTAVAQLPKKIKRCQQRKMAVASSAVAIDEDAFFLWAKLETPNQLLRSRRASRIGDVRIWESKSAVYIWLLRRDVERINMIH